MCGWKSDTVVLSQKRAGVPTPRGGLNAPSGGVSVSGVSFSEGIKEWEIDRWTDLALAVMQMLR